MISTMRELRQLIADNCDFSQPLRVVARDLGKKAGKHSTVCADEDHPARMKASAGMYDERGIIELAYDPEFEALMPEDAIAALDALLEEVPRSLIGWIYFFYFPMDYTGFLGRAKQIECSLLNTKDASNIYLMDDKPNTLVIEAKFEVGSFD